MWNVWVGGLFPKQDELNFLITLATFYFLQVRRISSSCFLIVIAPLLLLSRLTELSGIGGETMGWLQYVGIFGLLQGANKNL